MPSRGMSRTGGSKPPGVGAMRQALADGKVWAGLGLVWVPPSLSSHYDFSDGDVMVEVKLMPRGEALTCRLASGMGCWVVPPVGSEVAVLVPRGDFDAEPLIVGILSTEGVPQALDGETMVIVNPAGGKIKLAKESHHPVARVGDDIDMGKFVVAGTTIVQWIPPIVPGQAPGAPVTLGTSPVSLIGKVKTGSDNVESG